MMERECRSHRIRRWKIASIFLTLVCGPAWVGLADEIVLRNGNAITDLVIKMNVDGVHFKGRVVGWDEVDTGRVTGGKQAEFDKFRESLGLKLFRIRSRLETGDYIDLLRHVEDIYPTYVNRRSKTAYMVFQGLMWARLAKGLRAEALEPYFQCYIYLRSLGQSPVQLPGDRRLNWDPETGMTADIPPVWFDAKTARSTLPKVQAVVRALPGTPPAAAFIYYGTLAMAAGDRPVAEEFLRHELLVQMASRNKGVAQLQQVVLSQLDILDGKHAAVISRLKGSWRSYSKSNQAIALYWLGQAGVGSVVPGQREEGMLRLLYLPALYGTESPELAGAGLYHSMKTMNELKQTKAVQSLRKELMTDFGHTYFGRQVLKEINQATDEKP